MIPVIGLIASFILILLLLKFKVPLGLAMICGAVLVSLTAGKGLETIQLFWMGIIDRTTLELLAIIVMIGILGYILSETGSLKKMLDSLLALISSVKMLLVITPGLISFLAVPGGAIISAPMVGEIGDKVNLSPESKTSTNIIYRHIWYLSYPLYQAIILTADIADLSIMSLALFNIPTMVVGILVSYYIILSKVEQPPIDNNKKADKKETIKHILGLCSSLLPIIVVLVLGLVFRVHFIYALLIGIIVALGNLIEDKDFSKRISIIKKRAKDLLVPGINMDLIYTVLGIMIFRVVVEESGSILLLADILFESGIPMLILILVLPFITSFATGLNLASIGINLPIFLPIMPENAILPYVGILFISGLLGYLISPMHLCIALTKEYFKADMGKVFKQLTIPVLLMMLAGVVTGLFMI